MSHSRGWRVAHSALFATMLLTGGLNMLAVTGAFFTNHLGAAGTLFIASAWTEVSQR